MLHDSPWPVIKYKKYLCYYMWRSRGAKAMMPWSPTSEFCGVMAHADTFQSGLDDHRVPELWQRTGILQNTIKYNTRDIRWKWGSQTNRRERERERIVADCDNAWVRIWQRAEQDLIWDAPDLEGQGGGDGDCWQQCIQPQTLALGGVVSQESDEQRRLVEAAWTVSRAEQRQLWGEAWLDCWRNVPGEVGRGRNRSRTTRQKQFDERCWRRGGLSSQRTGGNTTNIGGVVVPKQCCRAHTSS